MPRREMTREEREKNGEHFRKLFGDTDTVLTPEQRREKELDAIKDKLSEELAGYQTTATEAARKRMAKEYAVKLADGSLTDEERSDFAKKIADPSLIDASPTESDYGDNLGRVKELLKLIQDPEKAEKQMQEEEFIQMCHGYAERHKRE